MRHMGLAWVAIVGVTVLGAPLAEAAVTCKIIPSWCPATDKNAPGSTGNSSSATSTKTAVPEPATLLLLGAGASAVGLAMRRRRKN